MGIFLFKYCMLTIVTHTNPHHNRDMSKCVDTVAAAIKYLHDNSDFKAKHEIIECKGNDLLTQARVDATKLDEFISFVDDDDYITQDGLLLCMKAITSEHGYGTAFTREIVVTPRSEMVGSYGQTYESMLGGPKSLHHLSVFRTSAITEKGLALAQTMYCGNEWVLKVCAGFNMGIIHIPKPCYYWVQHSEQMHKTLTREHSLEQHRSKMEMLTWSRPIGPIPIFGE